MQSWMRIVCLCAAAVLLSACVSLELGIVLCLCVAVWKCAGGGEGEGKQGPSRPVASSASRAARVATNVSARASSLASSSGKSEGKSEERRRRASPSLLRRPIVREALVRRVPLAAEMPVHPSEHVLDDCMLAEQRKRSVGPDARKYHSTALPNAIRAAARELTTSDPAIVPLDSDGGCARPLGEV